MVTIKRRGRCAWVDSVVFSYEEKLPMAYVCTQRHLCTGLHAAVVSCSVHQYKYSSLPEMFDFTDCIFSKTVISDCFARVMTYRVKEDLQIYHS
jgi:hypothetical protein